MRDIEVGPRGETAVADSFAIALLALLIVCATSAGAATLKAETIAGWEHYIGRVDASMKTASGNEGAFLQLDKEPSQLEEAKQGRVIVSQVKTANRTAVPHGLIHDWLGALFVADATLADVFAVTRGYDKYSQWYAPTIARATLVERDGDRDRFRVHYVRHVLFVTAVMDVDYETQYYQVSATRWYSLSHSTRIQENDQDNRPSERKAPADDGNGYLWRVFTLTRYEQRDKGVYVEQESIGLSRPIPTSVRWIVEPVVRRLAKDLLANSLEQTRAAVVSESGRGKRAVR